MEFYKVGMPEGAGIGFESILDILSPLDLGARCEVIGGTPVRLETHDVGIESIHGDITRIRMDDLPHKARLNAPVEALPLDENEGLGSGTAFLYDRGLGVLAIQRNQMGVLPSAWAKYFTHKAGLDSVINLDLILHPDAMARLAKVQKFRRFNVKVAAPGNASIFKDTGLGPGALIDLMEASPRATIDVVLSMGNEAGSLPKEGLLSRASKILDAIWLRYGDGEKCKLEVKGSDDLDSRYVIDLIKDRLIAVVPLPIGALRTIPYTFRKRAVEEAWRAYRPELIQMFGEQSKHGGIGG